MEENETNKKHTPLEMLFAVLSGGLITTAIVLAALYSSESKLNQINDLAPEGKKVEAKEQYEKMLADIAKKVAAGEALTPDEYTIQKLEEKCEAERASCESEKNPINRIATVLFALENKYLPPWKYCQEYKKIGEVNCAEQTMCHEQIPTTLHLAKEGNNQKAIEAWTGLVKEHAISQNSK